MFIVRNNLYCDGNYNYFYYNSKILTFDFFNDNNNIENIYISFQYHGYYTSVLTEKAMRDSLKNALKSFAFDYLFEYINTIKKDMKKEMKKNNLQNLTRKIQIENTLYIIELTF